MRIFVTGNRGQLGRELLRVLSTHDVDGGDLPELDVADVDTTHRAIQSARPDVVIHAAALTDTRRCEDEPDLAQRVNGLGSRNVAVACREAGAALVYVSTNEVFDGLKREPYVEPDAPHPINHYGRSKLEGERQAADVVERLYVVRTAWLYGGSARLGGGNDFPSKILAAAAQKPELTVVTDEVATPTLARDLAAAIARLTETEVYGIYHLTNAGECSRFEWAREVLRLAGRTDVVLKPATLASYKPYPPKPPYSVLRNEAGARLGITLRDWRVALAEQFAPPM
jgi:dTDP-4-dehydrorhamnose reductase